MNTIVLFTEDGPTGEAIRILARKFLAAIGQNPKIIRRQINRGDIFKNSRKLAELVKLVNVKERAKTIICVDSECTDPRLTESNLAPSKKALKGLQLVAHFIVVVHALETWLAADEEALRAALNRKTPIKISGNLEKECRPENILKEIYRKHGINRDFIKSREDVRIAHHANPARIAERCSSFRKFQQLLMSQ